jgi:predicted esterase
MPPFRPSAEPIVRAATTRPSNPAGSAALIFLHGLGDDGSGFVNIADQFQAAGKLPYMKWVFPSAPENRDAMQTAWYMPSGLSPVPSSRPELEDPEDEEGLLAARVYVEGLVQTCVEEGIPAERIVLGGFSQGHAVTALTGLTSAEYAGKLAGLVCLSGYLPLADKYQELRKSAGLSEKIESSERQVPWFIVRGTRDILVPKRYFRIQQETMKELGVNEDVVEVHEYEGLAHAVNGRELQDLCSWLEKVVPPLEE